MKINNITEYAKTKKYIVVREVENEYWYFSAWDDADKANEQALACGCIVIRNE
jgi:hypothetical protein